MINVNERKDVGRVTISAAEVLGNLALHSSTQLSIIRGGKSRKHELTPEADYYTALYHKEVLRLSLVSLFRLYYVGSTIFGDPKIRLPKVERFIGSVLSIANAYFKNPGARQTKENDLFLPTISNIPLEESIHVLIARDRHFSVGEIHADLHDFFEITKCYTGAGSHGIELRQYVETLMKFASKALRTEIPPSMYKEMSRL